MWCLFSSGDEDKQKFFPVFVGDATAERAAISVRTTAPRVDVRLMRFSGGAWSQTTKQTLDATLLVGLLDDLDQSLPIATVNGTPAVARSTLPPAQYAYSDVQFIASVCVD
jgi:hypothetical protein